MSATRIVLVLLLVGLAASAQASHLQSISAADLSTQIEQHNAPLVLDVRTRSEYESGHVPGAVNIPHTELPARLSQLEAGKGSEIVVYCEVGGRAAAAEQMLEEAGYTQVRSLEGHMRYWRAQGLPQKP